MESIGRPPSKPSDKQISLEGGNDKTSSYAFPAYGPPPKFPKTQNNVKKGKTVLGGESFYKRIKN